MQEYSLVLYAQGKGVNLEENRDLNFLQKVTYVPLMYSTCMYVTVTNTIVGNKFQLAYHNMYYTSCLYLVTLTLYNKLISDMIYVYEMFVYGKD